MEFLFEFSSRYFTSARGEQMKYRVEHEQRISYQHYRPLLTCLLFIHQPSKVAQKALNELVAGWRYLNH